MVERTYRIHPAIGLARLGDADRTGNDFFFIGPETPGASPNFDAQAQRFNPFKINGRIKPQAARFRIFEYEKAADGKFHPTGEVTLGDGRVTRITWTVHVASRKASFCQFAGQAGAGANPLFSDYTVDNMRNSGVRGLDNRRALLELDPGPLSIDGGDPNAKSFEINRPPLAITTLGQLRSEPSGRLIFIGGMGKSGFDPGIPRADGGTPGQIVEYANNDSWFDDVADGPVDAEIVIDGATQSVDGAWVLAAPPDFAPTVRSYRSMYDTLVDVLVRELPIPTDDGLFAGPLSDIAAMKADWQANGALPNFRPSFTRHIYPILSAVARMWRIYARRNMPTNNFHAILDPAGYGQLGGSASNPDARKQIFTRIRDPKQLIDQHNPVDPAAMPQALGDYYGAANGRGGTSDPAFFHSVSQVQYELLRAWKDGRFDADWTGVPAPTASVTAEGLDRAALENSVGGAFFPGIEASWFFTKAAVYRAPFRIARGSVAGRVPVPVPDGQQPTTRDLLLEAGAFSQQMALPWQADFLLCRSEEHQFGATTRRIAWWPVQRPDEVFAAETPTRRLVWARHADDTAFGDYLAMVQEWSTLGFIVETNGNLFETERSSPLVA
jgi:hypothetical protein